MIRALWAQTSTAHVSEQELSFMRLEEAWQRWLLLEKLWETSRGKPRRRK